MSVLCLSHSNNLTEQTSGIIAFGKRFMKVPILITFDIDPLTRDERIRYGIPLKDEQASLLEKSLELAGELTAELGIRSTFFVTASLSNEIEDELKELLKKKHQIGWG